MENRALNGMKNDRIAAMRRAKTYQGRRNGNLSEYMFASTAIGVFVALLALVALFTGQPFWLMLYPIISIPLGILQLVSGGNLMTKWSRHSARFKRRIANYWLLNLVYFLGLIALFTGTHFPDYFLTVWLFIAPWAIAGYQFVVVFQYWKTRGA